MILHVWRAEVEILDMPCKMVDNGCCCLVTQSCPTLCDPIDCSPPGSSPYGISKARILEWVSIPFSRGSSQPRIKPCLLHWQAYSFLLSHQGSPVDIMEEEIKKQSVYFLILPFPLSSHNIIYLFIYF